MDEQATGTDNELPQRLADFETLTEALEYASKGTTGFNFYDARGQLRSVLTYKDLRCRALDAAKRLTGMNLPRGARVALVADTSPEFMINFFGCRYAGLVPYAMPVPVNIGSHEIYVRQLRSLIEGGEAAVALTPPEFSSFLDEAARDSECLRWHGTSEQLAALPAADMDALIPDLPDEPAYLQFTSGSTRFPQGVVITERAVMSNLRGIVRTGLAVGRGDRCVMAALLS